MKAVILTAALLAAAFLARGVFADLTQAPAPQMTYWRTGGPRSSITLQEGVRSGPAAEWHSDGTLESEGLYADGLREGEWVFWLDDGSPDLERTGTYSAGQLVSQ